MLLPSPACNGADQSLGHVFPACVIARRVVHGCCRRDRTAPSYSDCASSLATAAPGRQYGDVNAPPPHPPLVPVRASRHGALDAAAQPPTAARAASRTLHDFRGNQRTT